MQKLAAVVCCVLLAAAPPAFAQGKGVENRSDRADEKSARKGPSEKQLAQQARMKDCNAQAKDMKGAERKKFMGTCLKGGASPAAMAPDSATPQQRRMRECNAKAKAMKGAERKSFMSSCLKG